MKREQRHTLEQNYARYNPGTETEPTVHESSSEVTSERVTCTIICAKGGDSPFDDEVGKTLVVL